MDHKTTHKKYGPCTRTKPHKGYGCPGRCNSHMSTQETTSLARNYLLLGKTPQHQHLGTFFFLSLLLSPSHTLSLSLALSLSPSLSLSHTHIFFRNSKNTGKHIRLTRHENNVIKRHYFIIGENGITHPICRQQLMFIYQVGRGVIDLVVDKIRRGGPGGFITSNVGGAHHTLRPWKTALVGIFAPTVRSTCPFWLSVLAHNHKTARAQTLLAPSPQPLELY